MIRTVCDSDLINVGLKFQECPNQTEALYYEVVPVGVRSEEKRREFYVATVMLCSPRNKFLTTTAQRLFGPQRLQNFERYTNEFSFDETAFEKETIGEVMEALGFQ